MKVKLSELMEDLYRVLGGEKPKHVKLQATSADVIKREIIRQMIYKESEHIAIGTKLVGVKRFPDLYVKWAYPSSFEAMGPIPEGAEVEDAGVIEWSEFTLELKKYAVRFSITDEALLRQWDRYQLEMSRKRASEAMAKKEDENIISVLVNNPHKTMAASAAWDSDSTTADKIMNDILKAVAWIEANSAYVTPGANNKYALVVPASLAGVFRKVVSINGVLTTIADALAKTGAGINVIYARGLDSVIGSNAILMVPGDISAIHGVLQPGGKIKLVEEHRDPFKAVTEYIIRKYFGTAVIPFSNTIVKITGVTS